MSQVFEVYRANKTLFRAKRFMLILHPYKPIFLSGENALSQEALALADLLKDKHPCFYANEKSLQTAIANKYWANHDEIWLAPHVAENAPKDFSNELLRFRGRLVLWLNDPRFVATIHPELLARCEIAFCGGDSIQWEAQLERLFQHLQLPLPAKRMHLPVWQHQYRIENSVPASLGGRSIDLCYFGYPGDEFRQSRLESLYYAYKGSKMAGGLHGKTNASETLQKMARAKATIVVGDKGYEYLLPLAHRVLQGWCAGCITFIDSKLDRERLIYANNRLLNQHLYVESAEQIARVLKDAELCRMLALQQRMLYEQNV